MGVAIGLVHEEWRGVGGICGHFPARVKAGGTGCKSEKKKRSDCSLFLGLCHIFSSHPSCFLLPGASRRHLPGYFSRRKKSQANPPQWDWWVEGKGRAGQERGGRHTWEVGSGGKSVGTEGRRAAGLAGLLAGSPPPCVLGNPLCRQGTSLLVCVLEFVHVVSCMIFVRLRRRGGAP